MARNNIVQIRNAAPQDFGGGERYPVLLANELSELGVDNIILSGQKKLIEFAKQNNVPVKKSWWCRIKIGVENAPYYSLFILFGK